MATVKVKKFKPQFMKRNRIIFILGKRHTGKSVLMKDLLFNMPKPDFTLAMAPTEDSLNAFREFLPEVCIYDHFNQEALDRVVSVQRELVNRNKVRHVLILLDDCMYQKNVLKSTSMRSIFFNGRHDNISLMCAAQYMMDVEPSFRTNIDYVFTMRETILTNRQKLHKYFFGQYARFADFDRVMGTCTQDYRCLVLDGTIPSTEASENIFWYKASRDVPQFSLCKPVFWSLSKRYGLTVQDIRTQQSQQFQIITQAASRDLVGAPGVEVTDDGEEVLTL